MREPLLILLLITFSGCSILGSGEDDDGPPRTIVFSSNEDGRYHIYSMREDGSGVKQLTDGEYNSTSPAWSPSGERIAYASTKDAPYGSKTLWVMDADGSNKKPLVEHPSTGRAMFGNHPSWSPDGTEIAFDYCTTCGLGGKNQEVFLADLNSGTIDTLTSHSAVDKRPTWSPDGDQIAFSSNRDYFDADSMRWRRDLYVINKDGGNLKRMTETGNVDIPNWGLNEEYIAYAWQHRYPDIYLLDMNTMQAEKFTNLKAVGKPIWSSDGSQLFISGTTNKDKHVLQYISIENQLLNEVELNFKEGTSSIDFDWQGE